MSELVCVCDAGGIHKLGVCVRVQGLDGDKTADVREMACLLLSRECSSEIELRRGT